MPPVEKKCVVCGQGSSRVVWTNREGEYVACDHHSRDEVIGAVNALELEKA